jgi:hypothetical protein
MAVQIVFNSLEFIFHPCGPHALENAPALLA